jgi:ribosomal protein S12 methylthiotransferase accessory factor
MTPARLDKAVWKSESAKSAGGQDQHPRRLQLSWHRSVRARAFMLGFCQQRGIPTNGIKIAQRMHSDRMTGLVGQIDLEIQLPPDFPEKYKAAVIRSAEQCAVKKHLEHPPVFNIVASTVETV